MESRAPLDTRPDLIHVRLDDAEAVAPPGNGWEGGLCQLDRGRLDYRGQGVHLPGACILWRAYEGRVLARWHYTGRDVCLLLPLEGEGPMGYRGRALPPGSVVWLHADHEHACVTSRKTRGIEIGLSGDVVDAWRHAPEPAAVNRLDPRSVKRLVATCRAITDAVRADPLPPDSEYRLLLREQLAAAAQQALLRARGDASELDGTRGYRLVRTATTHMLRHPLASKVEVTTLATTLGVPERTLYEAFRSWVGVPPYEYQRIHRLHAFRKALHAAPTRRGRVRTAGRVAGLPEGGRLAQIYRRHFAETPRETLRRWEREGSAFASWPT